MKLKKVLNLASNKLNLMVRIVEDVEALVSPTKVNKYKKKPKAKNKMRKKTL